jgi:hypothetical protein
MIRHAIALKMRCGQHGCGFWRMTPVEVVSFEISQDILAPLKVSPDQLEQ